jgi:hypothetical protein
MKKFSMMCFLLIFFMSSTKAVIYIRQIPERKLHDFISYRASMVVSPYKTEEKITSPNIANYLPVKIKLVGGPQITIRKEEEKKKKI